MKRSSLKILAAVAMEGELPLEKALRLAPRVHGDHRDQYPLAMLIEEEYLGSRVSHTPQAGAESMREFSRAVALHMDTLPRAADGSVEYGGVRSTGSVNGNWNLVFLKAKGALYLAERQEKWGARLFTILIAVGSAFLGAWIKSKF